MKVKKEESIASNSEEKPIEDEGYSFKRVTEDVYKLDGYIVGDCYKPRGIKSFNYRYSKEDI